MTSLSKLYAPQKGHSLPASSLSLAIILLTLTATECISSEPEMKAIPSGRFLMGSEVSSEQLVSDFPKYGRKPDYFGDESPQHLVEISSPFQMSKTEITVAQFRQFVDETGYQSESEQDGTGAWGFDSVNKKCYGRDPKFSWQNTGYEQLPNSPVVNVTWNDCTAYCQWLSKKWNRVVRLPTEAEWEYACRAGSRSYFGPGINIDNLSQKARTLTPTDANIRDAIQDLTIDNSSDGYFPVAVGSFAPNAFGLHDMIGNVWEWTADWHDTEYYSHSPVVDPHGPKQGAVKVRRGGGWNSFPLWARASFRNWNSPDTRCMNLGFRIVAEFSDLEIAEFEKSSPIQILFVGDVMLDNGPGNVVANGKDPFERCSHLLHDADLTIGNLECVLGRGGEMILKNYSFRGALGSENYLKKYFDAVSLANNHAFDFGPDGLQECINILSANEIGHFGAGDWHKARKGLVLKCKERTILFLGYNEFRASDYQPSDKHIGVAPLVEQTVLDDIATAKATGEYDYIIPYVHWGDEMVSMPLESHRQLARKMIDAGASAIIGSHPHVTQTIDYYRGSPIVYSLGNFVFDYYPVDPPLWTGWTVRLEMHPDGRIDLETTAVEMDPAGIPYPVKP
jgi:formylglycine-generating enzyme required for sulfatase activity